MVFLVKMMTEISCYLQLALVYRQALALSKTDASYVIGNFSSHMLMSYRECLIGQLKNTDFSWSTVNRDRNTRGAFLIIIAFSRVYLLKLQLNCRRRLLAMLDESARVLFSSWKSAKSDSTHFADPWTNRQREVFDEEKWTLRSSLTPAWYPSANMQSHCRRSYFTNKWNKFLYGDNFYLHFFRNTCAD